MAARSANPSRLRPPRAATAPAVLVLGASGGVGRGLVEALLAAGQPVIASGRSEHALAALGAACGDAPGLTLLPAALDSDADGAALARALRQLRRPLRAAVATLGGPRLSGRLLAMSSEDLAARVSADLTPHWVAARHVVPLLAGRPQPSRYVVLGGPCADHVWAGYGQCSVSAAALRMFVRALREEAADGPVRVQQLVVATPVATWRNRGCACVEWPRAVEVGQRLLELLDSDDTRTVVQYDAPGLAHHHD